jgi:hypothetical protein
MAEHLLSIGAEHFRRIGDTALRERQLSSAIGAYTEALGGRDHITFHRVVFSCGGVQHCRDKSTWSSFCRRWCGVTLGSGAERARR